MPRAKEILIKVSTYLAIAFVVFALIGGDIEVPDEGMANVAFWLGAMSVLIHYFLVLMDMLKNRRWAYVFGSVLFFFVPTFVYYFKEMKEITKNA